jgi:nucleotide-binding universal stress UspA family protein
MDFQENPMLKILVAVDGSELSLDGVRHALALVRQGLQASMVLVNVQEPATLYELVTSRDPDRIAAASEEAGQHLLGSARAALDAAGVAYETLVGVGAVAHTLVDMIETSACDLVVIGARGQGALSSALLGSVSQEVASASPVPVTIVKHSQRTETLADISRAAEPGGGL